MKKGREEEEKEKEEEEEEEQSVHIQCTCKKVPHPQAPGVPPTCSSSAAPGSVCLRPGWSCSRTAAVQCRGPTPPPPGQLRVVP